MISGRTTVYAILAHPVDHVQTPQALNRMFKLEGHDGVMVPMDIMPSALETAFLALRGMQNLGGAVITIPHKVPAVRLCDRLSARARIAEAVNVVRRGLDGALYGDLLDGEGFVSGLRLAGIPVKGRRAFIVGAGGAGSAIASSLANHGVAHLTVINRSPDRAKAVVGRLATSFPGLSLADTGTPAGHDLVINATMLGLSPADPLPLRPDELTPDMTIADVIMTPKITPLLRAAQALGCRTHSGRWMLEGQLSQIFDFLTQPAGRPE
jgi:shikimate dehydrogenase